MACSLRTISLMAEEVQRLPHGHRQHVGDRLAVQLVGQHFVLEALAAAGFAGNFHLVQEGQVGVDHAQALAGFAGALGVEAEQDALTLLAAAKALRTSSMMPV